jgi:hypothetical protein
MCTPNHSGGAAVAERPAESQKAAPVYAPLPSVPINARVVSRSMVSIPSSMMAIIAIALADESGKITATIRRVRLLSLAQVAYEDRIQGNLVSYDYVAPIGEHGAPVPLSEWARRQASDSCAAAILIYDFEDGLFDVADGANEAAARAKAELKDRRLKANLLVSL